MTKEDFRKATDEIVEGCKSKDIRFIGVFYTEDDKENDMDSMALVKCGNDLGHLYALVNTMINNPEETKPLIDAPRIAEKFAKYKILKILKETLGKNKTPSDADSEKKSIGDLFTKIIEKIKHHEDDK